jgi:hypothetical protein
MTWNLAQLNQILANVFVVVISLGSGYYFGYKTSQSSTVNVDSAKSIRISSTSSQISSQSINIVTKEVVGVQWIKPNQEPRCDKDHKIKGKFNSQANYYYTPTYKTYDKLNPEICFANEEFAKDSAGFIKKY